MAGRRVRQNDVQEETGKGLGREMLDRRQCSADETGGDSGGRAPRVGWVRLVADADDGVLPEAARPAMMRTKV